MNNFNSRKKLTIFVLITVIIVIFIILISILFSATIQPSISNQNNNIGTTIPIQPTQTSYNDENARNNDFEQKLLNLYKHIKTISGKPFDPTKLPYNYKNLYIASGDSTVSPAKINVNRCYSTIFDKSITVEKDQENYNDLLKKLDLQDDKTNIKKGIDQSC